MSGVKRTSICRRNGTWSSVTACPVLQPIGSSFTPTENVTSAFIMSHEGYKSGTRYGPSINAKWFFEPIGNGCKPQVTFIGDIFQVNGKGQCKKRADFVEIKQFKKKKRNWKTKRFCGKSNPNSMGVITAKWDDVPLVVDFRTNKNKHGFGFMALVSYEHCF